MMANNRLYIGNKETKQYAYLTKGYADGWDAYNSEGLKNNFLNFIEQTDTFKESNNGKTNLFFFTEADDIWDEAMEEWEKIESIEI